MPYAAFCVQKKKNRSIDPPCLDPLDYGLSGEPEPSILLRRGRVGLFETNEAAEQALKESVNSSDSLRANARKQFDFLILECIEHRSGWIDVKTELPDADTIVLIFTPSQDAAEPVWLGYYDDEVNQWRTPEGSLITVTHWQPLPEPPQ
jgi:hypothetical protein